MAGLPLAVRVYENPAVSASPNTVLADWTADVQDLQFSTNAFGGYQSCTFVLKRGFDILYRLMEGKQGQKTFVTNRLVVKDTTNSSQVVPWEGLIATMDLFYGSQSKSRSYLNMFNAVRVNHLNKKGKRKLFTVAIDNGQQNKFGRRVYSLDTKMRANSGTGQPLAVANRFITAHRRPNRFNGTQIGGVQGGIGMRVTCLGMADTLRWRYAYNNKKSVRQDTSEIVKEMLRATSLYKWREPNVGAYGQQFLTENFGAYTTTSQLVSAVDVQGRTRLDIIADCLRLGKSDGSRMLFQVFQGQNGKGTSRFLAQSNTKPFPPNDYRGYYYSSVYNKVYNRDMVRLQPYNVRAGNWIVDVDSQLAPPRGAADIFDDPRAIWIEETHYDADRDILKIITTDQAQTEYYLARLIAGTGIGTETI